MIDIDEKTTKTVKVFIFVILLIVAVLLGATIGIKAESKAKIRIVHVNFENTELTDTETWKYTFLKKEVSNYIEQLSDELGLDADLVVAILMVENPKFDPDAENRNKNGTTDIGLMQLNDKYIWSVFVPSYWDLNIEFNPYNWKHNLFIALHHLQSLQDYLKVQDDVIAAYNCGLGSVMNDQIPATTLTYVASVKNNYKLLKGISNDTGRTNAEL